MLALTYGERLAVVRRRRGETQGRAARRLRLSTYAYRALENAEFRPPDGPQVRVGKLKDFEACRLLRIRRGWSLPTVADRIGLSRWWVCLMERGQRPAERLVAFWEREGALTLAS